MLRRRKSSTPCHECHHHIHHHHGGTLRRGNHHEHVHHVHAHMSNTLRSKSTGQLIDDHHIRGSTRSRSRSKSKLDCSECYDNAGLSRSDRQSTRSTRWEVYRHVESPKKHLNSSQRRKSPIYKVNSSIYTITFNSSILPLFHASFQVCLFRILNAPVT